MIDRRQAETRGRTARGADHPNLFERAAVVDDGDANTAAGEAVGLRRWAKAHTHRPRAAIVGGPCASVAGANEVRALDQHHRAAAFREADHADIERHVVAVANGADFANGETAGLRIWTWC